MLPALHAYEHFSSDSGEDFVQSELQENFSGPGVDCDLCDFNFSSTDEPPVFSYTLNLSSAYRVQDVSIAETVDLYPPTLFSLRAPPVTIA